MSEKITIKDFFEEEDTKILKAWEEIVDTDSQAKEEAEKVTLEHKNIKNKIKEYLETAIKYYNYSSAEDPLIFSASKSWLPEEERNAIKRLVLKVRKEYPKAKALTSDYGTQVFLAADVQYNYSGAIDIMNSENWTSDERAFLKDYAFEITLIRNIGNQKSKEEREKEYVENSLSIGPKLLNLASIYKDMSFSSSFLNGNYPIDFNFDFNSDLINFFKGHGNLSFSKKELNKKKEEYEKEAKEIEIKKQELIQIGSEFKAERYRLANYLKKAILAKDNIIKTKEIYREFMGEFFSKKGKSVKVKTSETSDFQNASYRSPEYMKAYYNKNNPKNEE